MKNIIYAILFIALISISIVLINGNIEKSNVIEEITYEQLQYNMENPRELDSLSKPISKTNEVLMYTVSEIILYDKGDEQLLDECFALIDYYECILSNNKLKQDTSYIYELNNNNCQPVTFSDEALECLVYGYEYSKNSFDTFDITIGELTELWNFKEATKAPSDEDIEQALKSVDYNNVVIDENIVRLLNPDTQVDISAISKGFIADKVCEYLISQGVNSAVVNLGGNVRTIGYKDNETKEGFKIGIRKPEYDDSLKQLGYVEINNMSLVCSGDYEQYFIDEDTGVIYSHILDKSTGYPVKSDIAQVSIFCEKSVDGDGLSTTVYALGAEKGLELVESLDGVECLIIKHDGEIVFSSNVGYEDSKKITFVPF